jgi:hypothetical protein
VPRTTTTRQEDTSRRHGDDNDGRDVAPDEKQRDPTVAGQPLERLLQTAVTVLLPRVASQEKKTISVQLQYCTSSVENEASNGSVLDDIHNNKHTVKAKNGQGSATIIHKLTSVS